jgi:hypothetical protein
MAAMEQSLAGSVPPKTVEVNVKAFAIGHERGAAAARGSTGHGDDIGS